MKNPERILKILVFAAVLAGNLIIPAHNLNGQTVLNNNHLRFGHGSENSVNTLGNLQQPFYYNSTLGMWRKLTYSNYPLDNSFGIDGDGSNEWNLNGSVVQNPAMSSQSIDLSGYVATTSPNGYGTIVSTGTITIGGKNLEIKNNYELGDDNSFIKITTNIKNISGSNVSNVRFWVGTRDDYVGGTDQPKKEKGNLIDGAFAKITNPADRALALRISTADEGVLFYTNSSKGNNIINSCCDWSYVINTNPQLSTIEITNDGSYGFYVRMNDMAPGTNDEFTWYYASGKLEDLETIIADVAAASGAVSDISYNTATFKAKTSTAGTGYWIVTPRNATAPTELQIKSGVDYGSVDVVTSGSGAMLANIDKFFYITNLGANTNYDLHFVSEDATPAFSSIAKIQFVTIPNTIPELTTNSLVTGITLTGATSGGDVTGDGGQTVSARGVCWNTTGTPTVAGSKTVDATGTGSFVSSLTGLSEGTTYYARAYATNSVGTAYGNQVSFTTLTTSLTGCTGAAVSGRNLPVYIASGATIAGTTLEGSYISITGNYNSGEDVLGIDGAVNGTDGDITYSFDPTNGILTLTGNTDASSYQATLRKVTYTNTSATPQTGARTVKISLNKALPFSNNGHYYEFVTATNITWSAARTEASTKKYFGLQGYLVTITSIEESNFCISKLQGQGWLGASDEASEGTWKWVTGPENGTNFTFINWNTGEPNNSGDEDYAQFVTSGKWNDLNSVTGLNGYVVEYGGMAGDPVLDISDDVTVTISIPATAAATNITSASFEANWSAVSDATAYLIDVATDNAFTEFVPGFNSKDAGNITASVITGLNPVMTYYYRIRALLPDGTSFYSSITSAATLKAGQTITFADPDNKTYGDAAFELTATASSGLTVTFSSSDTDVATISGNTVTIVGGGVTTITASQTGDATYNPAPGVTGLLTVTKAVLTASADPQTKIYGAANPALTLQYSGFKNGDNAADLTTVPSVSTTITVASSVGLYDDIITVGGGTSDDYSFIYVAADFEVTKAALTVTADVQTKTYGSANPALTYEYSGFVNSDDASDLTTEPTASATLTLNTSVGIYDDDITLASGDDENYSFTYVPADFEVTKAALTITADAQTKVYGSANPALTYRYTGFVNEDDASDLTTEPVASAMISLTSPAGIYDEEITLAGGDDENYTFTYFPADFEVTKAILTVTADSRTKVYGSANPPLTYQYTGFLNDEDASDLTTQPTASATLTLTSSAGIYDDEIILAGGDDENYSFTCIPADFEVTKATLTVTADAQSKVYGSVNPALTYQFSGFVNSDDASDLTTEPTASVTIAPASSAGIYEDEITVAGGDDENYSFNYIPADFEVTKEILTVTANAQTKVYGSANPALTYQYSGFVNSENPSVLTTEPTATATVSLTSSVGIYDDEITLAGGDDENYSFTYISADFEVTTATLTVTADAKTKFYGSANPALTYQYAGFVNGEDESDLTMEPTASATINLTASVGLYDDEITLAGGDDENYSFTYFAADFEVTKATLTVTADAQSKVYGSANPALTYRYYGFVNDDDASDLTTEPSASSMLTPASFAGIYDDEINVAGGDDENYSFSYIAADFEVTKASLTVTADAQSKVYGSANPALTYQYTGFVNDDDASDLTTEPSASSTLTPASFAGIYENEINVAGGVDENYSFTYIPADFEVTKAILTISADSKTKVYGSVNPDLTLSYTGFKNEDGQFVIDILPSVSANVGLLSDAGNYLITLSGGSDNNYELNLVNGEFMVEKAALSVTADDKTRVYGQVNPLLTLIWSGFISGQDQTFLDVLPSVMTDANQNSDAGIYDIVVSGAEDNNYSFDYYNGTMNIEKADQVITFTDVPEGLRISEYHQLIATSNSGLPVNFELSDPDIANVTGDILTINREGNLDITASQSGDNNWNSAPSVTQSIVTLPGFDNIMSLFTPNNDGVNDYWYIPDIDQYGSFAVVIYNRFGKKVYQSNSYNNDWDGTWNGSPLPSTSYYYIIKSGTKGTITGVVNIVR